MVLKLFTGPGQVNGHTGRRGELQRLQNLAWLLNRFTISDREPGPGVVADDPEDYLRASLPS
jgi:hypothetical protein